ncbi:glycosyltransferase family 25 protein [Parvibaculum sp.]|uniref:glycosyltransferase family 25 protein n=1 Tax=Parvibaculum sp. TaxID=2024848 RepID=UPI0032109F14
MINLERHKLRFERMNAQLAACGLSFERVQAVEGADLTDSDVAAILSPTPLVRLSRPEIACFLSHRAAWRRFLAGNDEICCVLEDDVLLADDFGPALKAARNWASLPFDVIKIETMRQGVWVSRKKRPAFHGHALSRLRSCHDGTAGYIVSRRGARRLLGLTTRMDRPIDALMFDAAIGSNGLDVLQLEPALCIQEERRGGLEAGSEFKSSIDPARIPLRKPRVKRKGLAKLTREVARPFERIFLRLSRPGFERVMIAFEDL